MADTEIDQGTGSGPVAPGARAEAASRRRFVQLVGASGALGALSTLVAACGGGEAGGEAEEEERPPGAPPATDLEIVNYALFVEFLAEDFYDQVVGSGQVEDGELERLVRDIRQDETEHVEFLAGLASQLGGVPVEAPRTRFDAVIEAGDERILEVASTVENLTAAAYLGQAANIEGTSVLEAALSIHTVEARHAAALSELAGHDFREGDLTGSMPDGAFASPMTREEVLDAASPFLRT